MFVSLSLSLSLLLFFFSPACTFFFFQTFITCPISQGVFLEKKGKYNFSTRRKIWYLSITSNCYPLLIRSIALINIAHSLPIPSLNAIGSCVQAGHKSERGKMDKGPTSNTSYPQINFQICQETVMVYN